MVRVPSRVSMAFVVALLVASTAVSGVAMVGAQDAGDDVATQPANESYELEELDRGGYRVPEIHDGWRPISGSTAAAWLTYHPTDPDVDTSNPEDSEYLGAGDTVKRNYVTLTVMRLGDVETKEATFTVAYWDRDSREVTEGNVTRTESIAANQTVEKVSVTLSGKATRVRIPLRAHYDRPKEVTMWMESSESSTRWRFTHHSLKSSKQSGVNTRGGLAIAIGKVVVFGAVLVLVCGLISRLLARKSIVGPMKGMLWWTLVLGGVQLFGVFAMWDTVINLLSTTPELLALELGLVGFIQGIESRGHELTMDVIALRPDIEPAKTATGNEGVSSNGIGFDDVLVVTDSKGRYVLVEPGIIRWIIRLLGGRQYLEGTDTIRCDVEVTDGRPEMAFYVDPLSEEVIERPSPSLGLRLPEPSLVQLAAFGAVTYFAGVIAEVAIGNWQLGIAGLGLLASPMFLDAEAPNAVIEPAPPHFGEAHANSMVLAAEYDGVKTVAEAQDAIVSEQAKRNVAVERADEDRATTLVEETLGETDDSGDVRDIVDVKDDVSELLDRLSDKKQEKLHEDEVSFGDD